MYSALEVWLPQQLIIQWQFIAEDFILKNFKKGFPENIISMISLKEWLGINQVK